MLEERQRFVKITFFKVRLHKHKNVLYIEYYRKTFIYFSSDVFLCRLKGIGKG